MRPRTTLSLLHWSRASREAAKFAESGHAELERRRSPITAPTGRFFRFLARVPAIPAHLVLASLILGAIGCILLARYL